MSARALSVVVPFYNESATVDATIAALRRDDAELIFVDDGSTDGTAERLAEAARRNPNIHVVRHPVNRGLDAALRSGLKAAHGATIVVLDADLSYSPDHIDPLAAALRDTGAAIAIASPYDPAGSVANVPFVRLAISRIANAFLRRMVTPRLRTYTGMVRAYDRTLFERIDVEALRGEINCALLIEALGRGELVIELPATLSWPSARREGGGRLNVRGVARRTRAVLRALSHRSRKSQATLPFASDGDHYDAVPTHH